MRFEFAIAAKYLVPKFKQLSVSIISLLSVLVISLVVWLILVFLSVTDGLEKNWIEKLVSLNAPIRVMPTEAYYASYYYQIDAQSENASFKLKSIQEKLASDSQDPYDSNIDPELPSDFPSPDLNENGTFKDIVKETFSIIHSLNPSAHISETIFDVGLGQYYIALSKPGKPLKDTFFSETAYIASLPKNSTLFEKSCLNPKSDDLQNLLEQIANLSGLDEEKRQKSLLCFFKNTQIYSLKVAPEGFLLPVELLPPKVRYRGIGVLKDGEIDHFIIPRDESSLKQLQKKLKEQGKSSLSGTLRIKAERWSFIADKQHLKRITGVIPIVLDEGFILKATLDTSSLATAKQLSDVAFYIENPIQKKNVKGKVFLSSSLQIGEADIKKDFFSSFPPFWFHKTPEGLALPEERGLGEAVLLAKGFKDNGVTIGDQGFLSYKAATTSALQEMRIPIYVAGFYDPGIIPLAGKIILTSPEIASIVRTGSGIQSSVFGNGIQLWFDDLDKAFSIKKELEEKLEKNGLAPYWKVETFQEYEFSKDLIQQLKSDKNLFTLLAIIIIIVACSNIVSMLILLVNDKKKEIGILQSMGASSLSIALIFGTCGTILGLLSSLTGTFAAYLTLQHIDKIAALLSHLQGFDAFNTMFYGDSLPSQMSQNALSVVWIATILISLIAGLIPAIKATLLKPAQVLRSE